jgi:hypothetical protein
MKSGVGNGDFEERLTALTRNGSPVIMGTPFVIFMLFDFSGKKFCGRIENGKFSITNNSVFSSSGHLITGEFKKESEATLVTYTIKPMLFSYYWIRIIPILGFIAFNSVLLYHREGSPAILAFNVFFVFMLAFLLFDEKRRKRKLEEIFVDTFRLRWK